MAAMDGGWGWMVVLGCTIMHVMLGGWTRSYGIFYVKIRERFESSAAITAWVGGASTAMWMGGGQFTVMYIYMLVYCICLCTLVHILQCIYLYILLAVW